MKINELFNMLEKANEFKSLIGECAYRFNVCAGDYPLGTVSSLRDFECLLTGELHPDAARAVFLADVATGYRRQFVVNYEFDGQPRRLSLYTE